jgi:hypothetical protein
MFWVIFVLSLFSVVDSISMGKIENHIIIGTINNSLYNINIDQCICEMAKSNELISALNYFQTNETCQLFFYNINLIFIEYYFDSTLMFINQSSISVKAIQSTRKFTFSSLAIRTLSSEKRNFILKYAMHFHESYTSYFVQLLLTRLEQTKYF